MPSPTISGVTKTRWWCLPEAVKYRLPYEPALNGLRGLSILVVMVFHAVPLALPGGFLGVDVFFALSGYLITRLLLLEYAQTRRIDIKRFFTRRWLRLGPALIAMLVAYGLTLCLFSPHATLKNQGTDIVLALLYLTNWTRAFLIKDPVDLGHTWSLAIEEQFYMGWPLLLWFCLRFVARKNMILLIVLALVALSWSIRLFLFYDGASIVRLYNGLDTRLETVMWGAALAVWLSARQNGTHPSQTGKRHVVAWLALAGILWSFSTAEWTSDGYYQWGLTLIAMASVVLISCLHTPTPSSIKHLLSHPALVWLGTVSYGLYLWHFPVYRLLLTFNIKEWWLLGIGAMVTLPIAALSYYGLERPLLNAQTNKPS